MSNKTINENDPLAGSPTRTLLRLSRSKRSKVYKTFRKNYVAAVSPVRIIHRAPHSTEATGGVYKGQGRNRHGLMIHDYEEFLIRDE